MFQFFEIWNLWRPLGFHNMIVLKNKNNQVYFPTISIHHHDTMQSWNALF